MWPVSKIRGKMEADDDEKLASKLLDLGWVSAKGQVGENVLLSFPNGYETYAVIKRAYKKGSVQIVCADDGRIVEVGIDSLWRFTG